MAAQQFAILTPAGTADKKSRVISSVRQSRAFHRRAAIPALFLVAVLALPGCACRMPFSRGLPTLTSIREIRDLSPAEAGRRYPVRLKAITTYHDPVLKILMVQDATGGIRVSCSISAAEYYLGDVLTVQGITGRAEPYPIVQNAIVRKVGQKPMPAPVRLTPAEWALPSIRTSTPKPEALLRPGTNARTEESVCVCPPEA